MKAKRTFLFILFVISGILIGTLVAHLTSSTALSWLSYGLNFGISGANPLVIDLHIITLTFGLGVSVNLSQIIFVMLSLLIYSVTYKKF